MSIRLLLFEALLFSRMYFVPAYCDGVVAVSTQKQTNKTITCL